MQYKTKERLKNGVAVFVLVAGALLLVAMASGCSGYTHSSGKVYTIQVYSPSGHLHSEDRIHSFEEPRVLYMISGARISWVDTWRGENAYQDFPIGWKVDWRKGDKGYYRENTSDVSVTISHCVIHPKDALINVGEDPVEEEEPAAEIFDMDDWIKELWDTEIPTIELSGELPDDSVLSADVAGLVPYTYSEETE